MSPVSLPDEVRAACAAQRQPEAAAAFAICMNAINFGSGWWPTIRKRPGLSGYGTMETGITERFDSTGHYLRRLEILCRRLQLRRPGCPLLQASPACRRRPASGRRRRPPIGDREAHRLRRQPRPPRPSRRRDIRARPRVHRQSEAGELLVHGSPEEVELHAYAIHAIELLAATNGDALVPAEIDSALWNRGRELSNKSAPRPRSRNTAY